MPAPAAHADIAADVTVRLCDHARAPVRYLDVRAAVASELGVDARRAGEAISGAIRSRRISRVGDRGRLLWPPLAGPAPGVWVRAGAVVVPVAAVAA